MCHRRLECSLWLTKHHTVYTHLASLIVIQYSASGAGGTAVRKASGEGRTVGRATAGAACCAPTGSCTAKEVEADASRKAKEPALRRGLRVNRRYERRR